MPGTPIPPDADATAALVNQIRVLDLKWTNEFKGIKTQVTQIRQEQVKIQRTHEEQAVELKDLRQELGRIKPLTEDEQKALSQLVSNQLAQAIIRKWVGSVRGRLIGALGAIAVIITLLASIANLLRHGF